MHQIEFIMDKDNVVLMVSHDYMAEGSRGHCYYSQVKIRRKTIGITLCDLYIKNSNLLFKLATCHVSMYVWHAFVFYFQVHWGGLNYYQAASFDKDKKTKTLEAAHIQKYSLQCSSVWWDTQYSNNDAIIGSLPVTGVFNIKGVLGVALQEREWGYSNQWKHMNLW